MDWCWKILVLNMLRNICCSLRMIVDINFNSFFIGFTNRFSCQTAHYGLVCVSVWITIRGRVLIKSTAQMVSFILIRVLVILEKFVGQWWGFVMIMIFCSFVFHFVLVKIHITFFFVIANFIWSGWFLGNLIPITWCNFSKGTLYSGNMINTYWPVYIFYILPTFMNEC